MRARIFAQFAFVAAGAAIGACARFAVSVLVPTASQGVPLATLLVNLLGCAAIGVAAASIGRSGRSGTGWWFLVTGLLGGFTTFSSFSVEVDALLADQQWWSAAIYLGATLGGGALATSLAVRATEHGGGQR